MKTYGIIYVIYDPDLHIEIYLFLINKLFIFIFLIYAFSVPFLLNI